MQLGKNNKKITVVAVVLLLAITVIGAGLAYQAIFENQDNKSKGSYVNIESTGDFEFTTEYEEKTVKVEGVTTTTHRQLSVTPASAVDFKVGGKNLKDGYNPLVEIEIVPSFPASSTEKLTFEGGFAIIYSDDEATAEIAKTQFINDSSKEIATIGGIRLNAILQKNDQGGYDSVVKKIKIYNDKESTEVITGKAPTEEVPVTFTYKLKTISETKCAYMGVSTIGNFSGGDGYIEAGHSLSYTKTDNVLKFSDNTTEAFTFRLNEGIDTYEVKVTDSSGTATTLTEGQTYTIEQGKDIRIDITGEYAKYNLTLTNNVGGTIKGTVPDKLTHNDIITFDTYTYGDNKVAYQFYINGVATFGVEGDRTETADVKVNDEILAKGAEHTVDCDITIVIGNEQVDWTAKSNETTKGTFSKESGKIDKGAVISWSYDNTSKVYTFQYMIDSVVKDLFTYQANEGGLKVYINERLADDTIQYTVTGDVSFDIGTPEMFHWNAFSNEATQGTFSKNSGEVAHSKTIRYATSTEGTNTVYTFSTDDGAGGEETLFTYTTATTETLNVYYNGKLFSGGGETVSEGATIMIGTPENFSWNAKDNTSETKGTFNPQSSGTIASGTVIHYTTTDNVYTFVDADGNTLFTFTGVEGYTYTVYVNGNELAKGGTFTVNENVDIIFQGSA